MKKLLFTLFIPFFAVQANGQIAAKSIWAEYGFPNISKDSVAMYTMYGITRYRMYADDQYIRMETYQNLSEEQLKAYGPTMRSIMVKERASNDVFLCISMDDLQIKMKGEEKERESFKQMMDRFNSENHNVYAKSGKTTDVLGYSCAEILIKGTNTDTVSCFVTTQIALDPSISDFPLYVSNQGVLQGLMLGRNELAWNGQTLEFRATQLKINEPLDLKAELEKFNLVSNEKGNELLKAVFMKSLEQGKN